MTNDMCAWPTALTFFRMFVPYVHTYVRIMEQIMYEHRSTYRYCTGTGTVHFGEYSLCIRTMFIQHKLVTSDIDYFLHILSIWGHPEALRM